MAEDGPPGVPLTLLLQALGSAVASVETAPAGMRVPIGSASLLEDDDVRADDPAADLCLLVGVDEPTARAWLDRLARVERPRRPRAVATKLTSPALRDAAERAGIALLAVHPQARIELLLATVRSLLDGAAAQSGGDGRGDEPLAGESDLYGLAQTLAGLTGGLVSIEDERSQLLAYSASDGAADELRLLSILGREGPADYLRQLRDRGIFDRLRRDRSVVEVPADERLGWRRRLVVDIRPIGDGGHAATRPRPSASLGTIWIQEGRQPLDPDAGSVLEGAAAVAARLIERARSAPTQEALQIQRLLGLRGGGVDVPSLAAALSLPSAGPAAVIGLRPNERDAGGGAPVREPIAELAAAVRLHASAYARASLVAATDARIYVLIPRARSTGLAAWVGGLLDRLTARTGVRLRAAIAAPVAALADIGAARAEVDRVLDRPAGAERVSTLAESRTSVLLGEIADLVAERPQLRDPRLQALADADAERNGSLLASLEQYLDRFGDVRAAADALHVHPNTLRYRVRRAERVLGMRMADPADRLLLQIQILRWRRHG